MPKTRREIAREVDEIQRTLGTRLSADPSNIGRLRNGPSFNVGDFVKYDGKLWIITAIEQPPMSPPIYWLVDKWGETELWSAGEWADGFQLPLSHAKPGRARAPLEQQARKLEKRRDGM